MVDNFIFKLGRVISNTDEFDGGRIKVRIKGDDDSKKDSDLPFSFPLLPKMVSIIPKVGEAVLVTTTTTKNNLGDRFYIGPIISQLHNLKYDPEITSAFSLLNQGILKPSRSEKNILSKDGKYPLVEDISIQGRYNSDIIFKENQMILRCGQIGVNQDYNNKLGFIQMKNNNDITNINIVADTITLLSHRHKKMFNTTKPNIMIDNDELERIINYGYSLPYGELLVDFLNKLLISFINHTHPYDGMKPNDDLNINELKQIKMEEMLSTNIKIN